MIGEGLELMLVGMGVVFSFLILMVVLMRVSGALLSKLPEPDAPQVSSAASRSSGESGAAPAKAAKVAVALAAAYRAKHGS